MGIEPVQDVIAVFRDADDPRGLTGPVLAEARSHPRGWTIYLHGGKPEWRR